MTRAELKEAIQEFEEHVVIRGVSKGVFKRVTDIPIRDGKLARTRFGLAVGTPIDTDFNLVIDYYGYFKKSRGFIASADREQDADEAIKFLQTKIVFFQAIKVEDIVKISEDPGLIVKFTKIKDELLVRRGFKKKKRSFHGLKAS